jgi:drug/metabolite transporter (DMT)-like permease
MHISKKSYIYVLLAVIFWSSAASVSKLLLNSMDNLQVLFFISLISTISLLIIVTFQKKVTEIKKYNFKDYCYFAAMGLIGVFLYFLLFFTSMTIVSVQEAFIVNYTWPIWMVIFALLLTKEKITYKKIFVIIIGFIGVCIVITKGDILILSKLNITGDIFAFCGAILYGLFSVIGKKNNRDTVTSMMFYYGFSTIYAFFIIILFSSIPLLTINELAGLIWLGVFACGLAFVFWFKAIKSRDTSEMSNIIFLTPFISLVFIYLLIGEIILISSIIGLLLIIFGIYLNYRVK